MPQAVPPHDDCGVEARFACLAMGLDPLLGIIHVDERDRDSLPLDLI
jgi:hypothetical protein